MDTFGNIWRNVVIFPEKVTALGAKVLLSKREKEGKGERGRRGNGKGSGKGSGKECTP